MDKRRRQYLKKIQEKFGYKFYNLKYLDEAIDRTYLSDSYEFFGDIALYGAVTDFMIKHYTKPTDEIYEDDYGDITYNEGAGGIETLTANKLTELKIKLTNNQTFALIIRKLDLVNDMPLSAEDEKNGLRNNTHRLGDLYERIMGAIAIDQKYTNYNGRNTVSEIYESHIRLITNDIDLPEYTSNQLGDSDFTREVILKRSDLFDFKGNEITQLKLLVDKKKLPQITYDFVMKRDDKNMITYLCSSAFPKGLTIGLKCEINMEFSESYEDIHNWPTELFSSTGQGKSKNEAKALAAHALLNKLKARYGVSFLMTGLPEYEGDPNYTGDIDIEILRGNQKKLNRNVEISDDALKGIIKYNLRY